MKTVKLFIVSLLILSGSFLNAQEVFFNRGALVVIEKGCLVKAQGEVRNHSGTVENNGLFDIDGSHEIINTGLSFGNGEYRVKKDWINNNLFIADSSWVRLWGGNQLIGGNVTTTFWDLTNENSGVKTLGLNANVLNTLDLTYVETHVDKYKLTVLNPFVNSVLYDSTYLSEGFVSNSFGGQLVRYTDSNTRYLFPMGSSRGAYRFRRVEITPGSNFNAFNVGFQNYDADIDLLDRSNKEINIDIVNPEYYHTIYQSIGSEENVNFKINYLPADGFFEGLTNYTPRWSFISENKGVGFDYSYYQKNNFYLDSNNRHYAFALKDTRLQIKQLVTPNGDNKNDTWIIVNIELYDNKVKLFNRWGNLVFEQSNYKNDWDGVANAGTNNLTGRDKLPSGTYYYIVEVEGLAPQSGYIQLHID